MQKDSNSQSSGPTDAAAPVVQAGLSSEAQARRRLLVKGLGKGTAALVVVAPIQTLAAPTLTRLCTVSGVQSNVGSGRTGVKTDACKGYAPTYYATLTNWPNTNGGPPANPNSTVNGININKNAKFKDVFGTGSNDSLQTVLATPTSVEAVWVTALLNAIKQPMGFLFPYSGSQVIAYYNSTEPTKTNAYNFFLGYMQTVTA